jgi:hypothetical protein
MMKHGNGNGNGNGYDNSHTIVMFVIMVLAGFLSTMNIWVDKFADVRLFHLNDIYMILLMTGWMFLFMGMYYSNKIQLGLGIGLVVLMVLAIRYQLFVTVEQYLRGMIPHHSMAVLMSKELLRKGSIDGEIGQLAKNIIASQEQEIGLMSRYV